MAIFDLTAGDDVFDTTAEGDVINGLAGNDQLSTYASNSTLNGGDGDDTLYSDFMMSGNLLNGGSGADTIAASYGSNVDGGDGSDIINVASVESLRSTIHGGLGNDIIGVPNGDSTNFASIYGDDGDDQIGASGDGYLVDGGNGADNIDVLVNGLAWSEIYGGNDNDMIQIRDGVSRGALADGGNGNDIICLSQSMNLTIKGGAGDDNIFTGSDFAADRTLSSQFSNIDGGDGNDSISGVYSFGELKGGAGNDAMDIDCGKETVSGGDGNDTIRITDISQISVISGDAGDDILTYAVVNASPVIDKDLEFKGGTGNDKYIVDSNFIKLTELAGEGTDTVQSGQTSLSLAANLENAVLLGSQGLSLTGNAANNHLTGNGGNNLIVGGEGADVLGGGAGKDVFDYNALVDSGINGSARDVITDFAAGKDRIDLSAIDASTMRAGNNSFSFIGKSAFHHKAGELRYWQHDETGTAHDWTIVAGDVNGDGAADFAINMKGIVVLSAVEFVL
jgi:Ca2+-binding RTX toxin-like protein